MIQRPTKPRRFLGPRDELNYLNDVLVYYASLSQVGTAKARKHLRRFAVLLNERGLDDGSIMLQDHWALYHELAGNYPQAIRHRKREIALIRRLFEIGGPIADVNEVFLSAKMDRLAEDYEQTGQLDLARATRRELEGLRRPPEHLAGQDDLTG